MAEKFRSRLIRISLIGSSLSMLWACATSDVFPFLRGRVLDSSTLAPLDSVVVSGSGNSLDITSADGQFVIRVDRHKSQEISFELAGYETFVCRFPQDVEVDPRAPASYKKEVLLVRREGAKQDEEVRSQ